MCQQITYVHGTQDQSVKHCLAYITQKIPWGLQPFACCLEVYGLVDPLQAVYSHSTLAAVAAP